MRALIIDDEPRAREVLKQLLGQFCEDVEVCGEANGVQSGLLELAKTSPDFVLLDVQMGDGSGFDLLKEIEAPSFKVIFVTAFDEFAIEAFKFSAIDYVLKPIVPEDLVSAVDRVRETISKESSPVDISALVQNIAKKEEKNVVLKTAESVYLVNIKDIVRCQSDGNYTTFYLTDGRKVMVSKVLKEYDELFSGHGFFRVHQSHLINLKCFKEYDKKVESIIMNDNGEVPLASRKKEAFLSALSNL